MIMEKVRSLPSTPGVYLMKDAHGSILYVGKSKNLKKRVQSYFYPSKSHPPKVKRLVSQVRDLDYRVTDTEFEAFMLECKFIQNLKPMYNKKMKNPQTYGYVAIRKGDGFRQIEITGNPGSEDGSLYFGPYTAGKNSLEKAVQRILECWKISCTHKYIGSSACLNHSLGLCLGMCLGGEPLRQYDLIIDRFITLLEGRDSSLLDELEEKMADAAERFDFESAARYRDGLGALTLLMNKERVIGFTENNPNIVVYEWLNPDTLKLFLIRRNHILFSEKYTVTESIPLTLQARLKALILDYYGKQSSVPLGEVGRLEIDEAQIIFSYLQSGAGRFLLIPEEWMDSKGHSELEAALQEFLILVS